MSRNDQVDAYQVYNERLCQQEERLRREARCVGWEQCRFLDENDHRCMEPSVIGGYCRTHLLEYPYPHLVEHPRDRWEDAAVIAASPGNVATVLAWLINNDYLACARDLIFEIAGQLEEILQQDRSVPDGRIMHPEAVRIICKWYRAIPRQVIEFRVYLIFQGNHDPGYEMIMRTFKASGIEGLDIEAS